MVEWVKKFGLVAALAFAGFSAHAADSFIIDFEDVGVPGWLTEGPFTSNGFLFYSGTVLDVSGAQPVWTPAGYGAHSGNYATIPNYSFGTTYAMSMLKPDGSKFDVYDLWVKSYSDTPEYLFFRGTAAGEQLYYSTYVANPKTWTNVSLNFKNITGFAFSGYTDDIRVGQMADVSQIPEPETYAMLLAGLGVMSFIARRKLKPRNKDFQ